MFKRKKKYFELNNNSQLRLKKEIHSDESWKSRYQQSGNLTAWERLNLLLDENSFEEYDRDLVTKNLLDFPGYEEKLKEAYKTGLSEAVIIGRGTIEGNEVIIGVLDSAFMMGSMGAVVGEKICRAVDKAIELQVPLILCNSSGGARIQEGMYSLIQMARTSAMLSKLNEQGLLYISILTHPTTGGVCASFASLGDVIIAEPGSLIGFTGPRVIKSTLGSSLPEKFQTAEFLLEHGMIDLVVEREELREVLANLLSLH